MEQENNSIPQFLEQKLIKQYGEELTSKIIDGYKINRYVTLRVNTLKATKEEVIKAFEDNNIEYKNVKFSDIALIIKNTTVEDIEKLDIYEEGKIYVQSLSSMLPPIVLEPEEKKDILDMAAAPGGKTTQMAALTSNNSLITACELNTIRAERLKYNINKQGAKVNLMVTDARRLDDYFSFDQILLDAPCSGSGTINLNDFRTFKGFTPKLVEKSQKAQRTLLKKAINVLKPGATMVYSTCSILEDENEIVLNEALKSNQIEIVPIEFEGKEELPLLPSKIDGTLLVMPNDLYEGFFVAKLRKKK